MARKALTATEIATAADAAALMSAIKSDKPTGPPPDKLDHIRNVAKAMRNLMREIEDAEAALSEKKVKLYNLQMKELPDLFDQYNIPSLTLGAEGNNPEVELVATPYYKAVLPKDEEDRTLPAGIRWLEKNKHGDLIKQVFTISLPMDSVKDAAALKKFLAGPKGRKTTRYQYEVKQTVPWNTLTAFVKEQIEKGRSHLPLDILGATVGRIVKMKQTRQRTRSK